MQVYTTVFTVFPHLSLFFFENGSEITLKNSQQKTQKLLGDTIEILCNLFVNWNFLNIQIFATVRKTVSGSIERSSSELVKKTNFWRYHRRAKACKRAQPVHHITNRCRCILHFVPVLLTHWGTSLKGVAISAFPHKKIKGFLRGSTGAVCHTCMSGIFRQ